MAEPLIITAGSRPVYEIVKSDDGLTVTIREAQNHEHKIDLISSVIPTLIRMLQKL
jgi:hypothetical protein